MEKVCAFFGHRDAYHADREKLTETIRRAVCEYGCTAFWCGGCGAFDSLAAQTVRSMKEQYPHIRLVLVYAYLPLQKDPRACFYDETIYPDGLETVPKRFAIARRNDWMARRCDLAVTLIDLPAGGAYRSVKLLLRLNKPVLNLGRMGKLSP